MHPQDTLGSPRWAWSSSAGSAISRGADQRQGRAHSSLCTGSSVPNPAVPPTWSAEKPLSWEPGPPHGRTPSCGLSGTARSAGEVPPPPVGRVQPSTLFHPAPPAPRGLRGGRPLCSPPPPRCAHTPAQGPGPPAAPSTPGLTAAGPLLKQVSGSAHPVPPETHHTTAQSLGNRDDPGATFSLLKKQGKKNPMNSLFCLRRALPRPRSPGGAEGPDGG